MRPRKLAESLITPGNQDFKILQPVAADIRSRILNLDEAIPDQMLAALEAVLDPIRTGRTRLSDLDNVEKTFVGLKVEHFVRDMLGAPKGIRDLILAGEDVDVKNTVGSSWAWMIPPETYNNSGLCLLMALDEARWQAWMGLFVARPEYLGGLNRDGKRGILASSYANILWLVQGKPLPHNPWDGIDMARFRELRQIKGGTTRAATYFSENLGRPTHRTILQALLFDQLDYMKRVRGNGGAKDILKTRDIALLSGTFFNDSLSQMGLPTIAKDEFVAIYAGSPMIKRYLQEIGEL